MFAPSEAGALRAILAAASPGDTILLADGTYALSGGDSSSNLNIPAGVTLRSVSGDAAAVVLEGGYATTELVTLSGDGAALAEVTLAHAYGQGVGVRGAVGAQVYGVVVEDAGDVGIGVWPERGAFADGVVIGCSRVTRTDTCGVGIDVVQADRSRIYETNVYAPDCDEPGMRFATGSRGTVLERSRVTTGGAVGVAWGDDAYTEGDERVYGDGVCTDRGLVGHYGGVLRNVFVSAGIRVEDACGGHILHNSVWGGDLAWAFSVDLRISNNLASVLDGDGGLARGNRTPVEADFVDPEGGDLHLADGSASIDAGIPVSELGGDIADDIDRAPRTGTLDVGADER